MLNELGGGCQVPIGAHAEVRGNEIRLTGVVARPDGTLVLRDTRTGSDPVKLARTGKSLLERGGREILKEVYGENAAVPVQP